MQVRHSGSIVAVVGVKRLLQDAFKAHFKPADRQTDSSLGPGPAPPTTFSRVAPPTQGRLTVRMVTQLRSRARSLRASERLVVVK